MPPRDTAPAKALRVGAIPDSFTRSLYACAPYRGCGHGCRYCDGRAERYYVEGDFERDLEVRANLPAALAAELPGLRDRGMISFGSGVTDAYQPLEAERRITGDSIPALRAKGWPVLVITKSALARRDLEAWKGVDERGGFLLYMTVTGLDESLREAMEPGASSYRDRLDTLAAFSRAGMVVGALAMPLLPRLNDDETQLKRLYGALKETGAAFIMGGGLTLRPGRQKACYLEALRKTAPGELAYYDGIYSEERPSGAPLHSASAALRARCVAALQDTGLPPFLPHKIFSARLPAHDAFGLLLRDMQELYAARGVDVRPLRAAADRYDAWLKTLRGEFRRRRTLPSDWLEDRFRSGVELGEADGVLDNPKLADFARETVLKGRVFDYAALKLADG